MYKWRMNPVTFQRRFLRQIGDLRPIAQLLNLLPDVAFFVKDRQCRFVLNNARGVEVCGAASEEETIGKLGYEFFSEERMEMYLAQDREVMRSGKPILNALCPAPEKGNKGLIVYSKVPLCDRRGRIIGLAGMHREIRSLKAPPAKLSRMERAIQMIHDDYAQPLTVAQLAGEAGISRSQFDRQFHRLFGATPREYLLRVRVHAACRLLIETSDTVTRIALRTGFYDQSHFSRTFRRIVGTSPRPFRKRHATQ